MHLISHGSFGGLAGGDASAVFLDDGAFTAAELSPMMAAALRRAAPLVMFNTCHCGRIGFSLSRLGSWALTWCSWVAADSLRAVASV